MSKLIMMLLVLFLGVSCRTKVAWRLVCNQVHTAKINPKPLCNISFTFNRCQCFCFDPQTFEEVDPKLCGENFQSGDFELERCEGISGWYDTDWAKEIKPKVELLNDLKSDYCPVY